MSTQRYRSTRAARLSAPVAAAALILAGVSAGLGYLSVDSVEAFSSSSEPAVARAAVPANLIMSFSPPQVEAANSAPVASDRLEEALTRPASERSARSLSGQRVRRMEAPRSRAPRAPSPDQPGSDESSPDQPGPDEPSEAVNVDAIDDLTLLDGEEIAEDMPQTLSPGDIAIVHRANAAVVGACHRRALRSDPFLRVGKAGANLKVSPEGRVTSVDVESIGAPELEQCLSSAIARWKFPASAAGAETNLSLVFDK